MTTARAIRPDGSMVTMETMEEAQLDTPPAEDNDKKDYLSCKRVCYLIVFLLLFPIVPLFLSVVFGSLLAWVENVPFLDGFLYVASNLLNMANPLTNLNPNDGIGIFIDVYVSLVALLTFGIVLNVVHAFYIPVVINQQIGRLFSSKVTVVTIAIAIVIPALFSIIAVIFGVILAPLEGWNAHDGILYMLSNLLGLGTPLTDVMPTTVGGDIFDIVVSSMALGCMAVFVDYVASMNPARYMRKRTKAFLRRQGLTDVQEKSNFFESSRDGQALTANGGRKTVAMDGAVDERGSTEPWGHRD